MIWLLACAGPLHEELRAREALALADPPPVVETWEPDGALRLSGGLVEELVSASAGQALQSLPSLDLGWAELTVQLQVDRLKVVQAGCTDCVALGARLSGTIGGIQVYVEVRADVQVTATPDAQGLALTAHVAQVPRLVVIAADTPYDAQDWLPDAWPPVPLGTVGGSDLPIADLRVASDGDGVRAEFVTATPDPARADFPPGPDQGFEVAIHQDTLLSRARRSAFQEDPGRLDIFAEPTGLRFDEDRFELDVRLWRLQTRRGWWRDVRVFGALRVEDGELRLEPQRARVVDKSRGAAAIDPLGVLVHGVILKSVKQATAQAVPLQRAIATRALTLTADVHAARGEADLLILSGQVRAE